MGFQEDDTRQLLAKGVQPARGEVLEIEEHVSVADYEEALQRVEDVKEKLPQAMWNFFHEVEEWKSSQSLPWVVSSLWIVNALKQKGVHVFAPDEAENVTYAYRVNQDGESRMFLVSQWNGLCIRIFTDGIDKPREFLGAIAFDYPQEDVINGVEVLRKNKAPASTLAIGYAPQAISPEYFIGEIPTNIDQYPYVFGWGVNGFVYKQGEKDMRGRKSGIEEKIDVLAKGKEAMRSLSSGKILGLWDGSNKRIISLPPSRYVQS